MATEAIELVKILKPKIGEQAATKLIDYADKQRDKSVDRLWIATGILAAFVLGGFTMLYSAVSDTRQELKTEMNRRFVEQKTEMNRRFAEQKAEVKENRKLLLQILQMQQKR